MKIPAKAQGLRLDRWLAERFSEHSRSFWQKEVNAGRVFINDEAVTPHLALRGGETLTLVKAGKPEKKIIPALIVIAEEPDFLIIEKPAGLLVHPTDTSTEPTLVDALLAHDPAIAKVGDDPKRAGIVHRLDKLVSGVMVIAKTQEMFRHLKAQFAARDIEKEYLALAHGKVKQESGEITFPIGRSRRGGRMAARPLDAEGREAKTNYEIIERFANATLLRVRPETGRTHQIRAHFHALGYPLVGDPLYRPKSQRHIGKKPQRLGQIEIPRLMLHATMLSFTDVQGEQRNFETPPPAEFNEFLKKLKVVGRRV